MPDEKIMTADELANRLRPADADGCEISHDRAVEMIEARDAQIMDLAETNEARDKAIRADERAKTVEECAQRLAKSAQRWRNRSDEAARKNDGVRAVQYGDLCDATEDAATMIRSLLDEAPR